MPESATRAQLADAIKLAASEYAHAQVDYCRALNAHRAAWATLCALVDELRDIAIPVNCPRHHQVCPFDPGSLAETEVDNAA